MDGTGAAPLVPGTLLSPRAPAQKFFGDLGREKENIKKIKKIISSINSWLFKLHLIATLHKCGRSF